MSHLKLTKQWLEANAMKAKERHEHPNAPGGSAQPELAFNHTHLSPSSSPPYTPPNAPVESHANLNMSTSPSSSLPASSSTFPMQDVASIVQNDLHILELHRGQNASWQANDDQEEEALRLNKADLKNAKVFAQAMKHKVPAYVPILKWLKSYNRQEFFADLLAAITVAVMLVPQCLAYAILAGLPPIAGLVTGFVPVLIYSLMGSCRQLAIGPEALLSVLLGTILGKFDSQEEAHMVASTMALAVGVIAFMFGVLQFGFMGSILSRWVLAGFINAVAAIIALSQVDALLGLHFPSVLHPYEKVVYAIRHITETNLYTLALAITSCVFLVGMRYFKKFLVSKKFVKAKYIPEIALCVLLGIVVTVIFRLDQKGVKILGHIEKGFPTPRFPRSSYEDFQEVISDCILIVIVGFVEATAVSKSLASKHNYSISSNRELIAFGVSNVIGSFFHAYPSFSSIPRTSVQDMAGSRTCMTGFIVSIIMFFVILFLTPLFFYLPMVTMASVIFIAAISLFEFHEAVFLFKTKSWSDLLQFMVAMLVTFIFEVEVGILISVGMCVFLVLKHASAPHVYSVLGRIPGTKLYKDVVKFPMAEPIEGILLIKLEEVLYFANIGQVKQLLQDIENMIDTVNEEVNYNPEVAFNTSSTAAITPLQVVVLQVASIPSMDASALATIEEIVSNYKKRHMRLAFVQVSPKVREGFERAGLMHELGEDMMFDSTHEAITYLENNVIVKRGVSDDIIHSNEVPRFGQVEEEEESSPYSVGSWLACTQRSLFLRILEMVLCEQ
eukprot:TRINITY_DN1341_c0_g1_i3.p1 TRINITY_DN1341_c0_g1~~TRINITY_DN1341_c0_g1_i3.p1  ORF type:complete len:784 (+),score=218.70 TRINITY_DN1341_c0_g1_i3:146-2497(+)